MKTQLLAMEVEAPMSLALARTVRDARLQNQHWTVPPRLWPVIIAHPESGYIVVPAAFAGRYEFEVVK